MRDCDSPGQVGLAPDSAASMPHEHVTGLGTTRQLLPPGTMRWQKFGQVHCTALYKTFNLWNSVFDKLRIFGACSVFGASTFFEAVWLAGGTNGICLKIKKDQT